MVIKNDVEVVISGMGISGPRSRNNEEFYKNLLKNENLVGEARWKKDQYDLCDKAGLIPEMDYFDQSFFFIHRKQARYMDPMNCILMEKTFEAIVDAGLNIKDIKGKCIGVFVAFSFSDHDAFMYSAIENVYGVTGQSKAMLANRISYWLNVTGPSCTMNASWNGGTQVIEMGCEAIRTGQCEAALVGAANIISNATSAYANQELGLNCMDGITKPFDDSAHGYARSELAGMLFLQRATDAKRHYATIVHAKFEFHGNPERPFRETNTVGFQRFLSNFYNECGVKPKDVQYLEAYGCGIKKFDEAELNVIEKELCKGRDEPLPIGSVKSNAGHAETASDIMSVIKVLHAMERGIIPATLHYKTPNRNIPGLINGSLEVITRNRTWEPRLAAINGFGFGNSFGHILLKPSSPVKARQAFKLPLLKLLSSRTEEGIKEITDTVASDSDKDIEYTKLINDVFSTTVQGHLYRGYVMHGSETKRDTTHISGKRNPIWFVYSGMGSQWPQMGKDLMQLPIFANTINECHEILKKKGLDLRAILMENNSDTFENITHSFVGIAAVQIGLTNVLAAAGIVPDGIIGHSVGELGCAYADGCLTMEQMILSAYYRGQASRDAALIPGMMAAVGMGYKKLKNICPPTIEVACHNGADSATLSGPRKDMEEFVAKLQAENVFARLVNVSNIAYHSRYIKPIAPFLRKYLEQIIPEPKARSYKWISTSIEKNRWNSDLAATCSPEYLTNNLLSFVYFEESCHYIPREATLIEIAPHGLLQAILKRSLSTGIVNVPLTQRGSHNGLEFLFSALGKLYLLGIDLNLDPLYPIVKFPVHRGTKSLSPLVRWMHLDDCRTDAEDFSEITSSWGSYTINLNMKNFQNITGYRIGRKFVVPPTSILMLVYELFTKVKCNILFENICIKSHILQSEKDSMKIAVMLHRATGEFEIFEEKEILISGKITMPDRFQDEYTELFPIDTDNEHTALDQNDIYNEFLERGYNFTEDFRSVKNVRLYENGLLADIEWKNNWSAYLSAMMQLHMLRTGEKSQNILLPKSIRRLLINFKEIPEKGNSIETRCEYYMDEISCKFAQISDIVYEPFAQCDRDLTFQDYRFVSYQNENIPDIETGIDLILQIILQNLNLPKINIYHFQCKTPTKMEKYITDFKRRHSLVTINYTAEKATNHELSIPSSTLVIVDEGNIYKLKSILTNISDFVLMCFPSTQDIHCGDTVSTVVDFVIDKNHYYLLRKVPQLSHANIINIASSQLHSTDLQKRVVPWVQQITTKLSSKTIDTFYLVFYELPLDGIENFVNNLKSKYLPQKLRIIFILDKTAPKFSTTDSFYKRVFQQDLQMAVFRGGVWGTWLYKRNPLFVDRTQSHLAEKSLSEISIDVKYVGLNLDTWACDSKRKDYKLGPIEYVGVDRQGNRVMGIARVDMAGLEITPDPILVWPIPDTWSFAEAATVPYSYAMAYYALVELTHIKPDSTMLIHNACSSFGRALCQLGLQFGCKLYLSVGSAAQKASLLESMKPKNQITEEKILDYNDNSFEYKLLSETKAKGIDIIVNCLPGDRMRASFRCVSNSGIIVQVNISEEDEGTTIGLGLFHKCLGLYGLVPQDICKFPDEVKQNIHSLVIDGLRKKIVDFHSSRIFNWSDTDAALRYLDSKTVVGSAVVPVEKQFDVKLSPDSNSKHYNCDQNSCYLIYGQETPFTAGLLQWLAVRGCRKAVVITQTTSTGNYFNHRLSLLNKHYGTNIRLVRDNLKGEVSSIKFLQDVHRSGSISAVFVLANSDDSDCIEFIKDLDVKLSQTARNAHLLCLWCDGKNMMYKRRNSFSGSNIVCDSMQGFASVAECLGKLLIDSADIVLHSEKSAEAGKSHKDFGLILPVSENTLINLSSCLSPFIEVHLMLSMSAREPTDVPPVFIIPDILGSKTPHLISLARKLMYPTYVIELNQAGDDFDKCIPVITQKIKQKCSKGPFNLIGISWGGALAIEVAKELETIGEQVELFLVDGVPETIQSFIKEAKTRSDLEVIILKYMLQLQQQEDINMLSKIETWSARVEKSLSLFGYSKKQNEKLVNVLHLIKRRIDSIISFKPKENLINGSTHLVIPFGSSNTSSRSLTKYCKQMRTEIISGNHLTILQEDALALYINNNMLLEL